MYRISPEFYEQGLALYQSGGTLLQLHETQSGIEAQERAAEEAFVPSGNSQPLSDDERNRGRDLEREAHCTAVRERFRPAEQSLLMGFSDGMIADVRRALAGRGGQRA